MARKPRDDGGSDISRSPTARSTDKPFDSITLEDSLTTSPAGYTADGKTLYWIDSRGREHRRADRPGRRDGRTTVLAENARADIGDTLRNPRTRRVEAYRVEYLQAPNGRALDPDIGATSSSLKCKLHGECGRPVAHRRRRQVDRQRRSA